MMQHAGRYHAQGLVRQLLDASLPEVPELVRQIGQIRKFAERLLRQEQQRAAEQSQEKLHTALALLPGDRGQLDYLYERLLQAGPEDFPILRDALAGHKEELCPRLRADAESAGNEDRRLRAAAALASYDPSHPCWQTIRTDVAQALTRVSPEFLGEWKEALRPVKAELLEPLSTIFRNQDLGELQLALATSTLADYAADDVHLLADLLNDANPKQFAGLFPVLARHGDTAIRELEQELDKVVEPTWTDPPLDPAWQEVPASVRQAIEAAHGMVEERFALCQAIPAEQLEDLLGQLGTCGYRPSRIRPYWNGSAMLAAAVWTRDGRAWQWLGAAAVEQLRTRDADLRREGFTPADVAVVCSRDGSAPCYTAIWEQGDASGTEVRLVVGPLGEQEQQAMTALTNEKFNCQIANVVFDERGQPHGASLWTRRKDQQKSTTRLYSGPAAEFRADDCPGFLLTDVELSQWAGQEDTNVSPLLMTALWNISIQLESQALPGLSPDEQLAEARRLAAEGFRPAAISVSAPPAAPRR
jgi:hypothetical protein